MFPWPHKLTPRELMLQRLSQGVPPELVARAAGVSVEDWKGDDEIDRARAEGEILIFEQIRDGSATGGIRAAMRRELKTWTPKAEVVPGVSLEDLLRDD